MTTKRIDGQMDFSGGCNMVGEPGQTQYRYAENIVIRRTRPEGRQGMRRAFPGTFSGAFYFNQEDAKFGDAAHTGFWFDGFSFFGELSAKVQGTVFFKFQSDTETRQIVVSRGRVYQYKNGIVTQVATVLELAEDEEVVLVQGNNKLVMLRTLADGTYGEPMYWGGINQAAGFVQFTSAGTSNRIPLSGNGEYIFDRIWLINQRDYLFASDLLDFDTYDYVHQQFSIAYGDGDELVRVIQFQGDYILAFKKKSIYFISGANSFVESGHNLDEYVKLNTVSRTVGLVGRDALVQYGEQVAFLSYKGITSISRTTEGNLMGADVTLSAPIQPLIDRINWKYADGACAGAFDNYLMFAVPLDNSTTNNVLLVYDLLAGGGQGAWIPIWRSDMCKPVKFFNENENFYFLNHDGAFKQMFVDDHFDTNSVMDDMVVYDSTKFYDVGEYVYVESEGTKRIYKSLIANVNVATTNTSYWTLQSDPQRLFQVQTLLWTRFFKHQSEDTAKKYGRGIVVYEHQNPNLTVEIEDKDFNTLETLFANTTYDKTKYDIHNTADWTPSNINDDWENPHRQDYVPLIPANSFYINADGGFKLNIFETHSLRFIPILVNPNEFSLRFTNTTGMLKLKSIQVAGEVTSFAGRER